MKYPNKEESPQEYIRLRLKELRKSEISQEEKALICSLAIKADYLSENMEGYDIENVHMYVLSAFEMACDLIKTKNHKNQSQIIRDIIQDSDEILSRVCEIEERIMRILGNTNTLERKIIMSEITAEMRDVN